MEVKLAVIGINEENGLFYLRLEHTDIDRSHKYYSFYGVDNLYCRVRDHEDSEEISFKCHPNIFYRIKNNSSICFYVKKRISTEKLYIYLKAK